jgi:hypothetical protein
MSSVTVAWTTLVTARVGVTESVPFISQYLQIVVTNPLDVPQLLTVKPIVLSQRYVGVKPELGTQVLPINMGMARLTAVMGIEVEAIRSKT